LITAREELASSKVMLLSSVQIESFARKFNYYIKLAQNFRRSTPFQKIYLIIPKKIGTFCPNIETDLYDLITEGKEFRRPRGEGAA
jgi:hypothetical protein